MIDDVQKSILATLAFFDLFEYPLTKDEIWRYLFVADLGGHNNMAPTRGLEPTLGDWSEQRRLVPTLDELVQQNKINQKEGFYFLLDREEIIQTRKERREISLKKIKRAQKMAKFLSVLPFIKMVAACNVLGYLNAKKEDDIDLFIITTPNRIWLARWWSVGISKMLNLRPRQNKLENKFCFSFFITASHLNLQDIALENDIYFYYWLAQLILLYDEDRYFDEFIKNNQWVSKHLNTKAPKNINTGYKVKPLWPKVKTLWERISFNVDEKFVKWWQIRWMPNKLRKLSKEKIGVIISDDLLKFHLNDKRVEFRDKWLSKISKL